LLKLNTKPQEAQKYHHKKLGENKSNYLLFQFSMAPMEESQILEPIPFEN
jgi:hypothetical protein